MPLLNPVFTVPPEQTVAQSLVSEANQLLAHLVQRYAAAYRRVWSNKAATPERIVAAMGAQAEAIFTHSAALAAFINSFGQQQVPATSPAGWTVTFNADGSATATYTAPAEN